MVAFKAQFSNRFLNRILRLERDSRTIVENAIDRREANAGNGLVFGGRLHGSLFSHIHVKQRLNEVRTSVKGLT